jgi:hypothetical protein
MDVAVLILKLGCHIGEGGGDAMPRLLYPRERRIVPVVEETRWAPGPSTWIRGRGSLLPLQGFEPRTVRRYTGYAICVASSSYFHRDFS